MKTIHFDGKNKIIENKSGKKSLIVCQEKRNSIWLKALFSSIKASSWVRAAPLIWFLRLFCRATRQSDKSKNASRQAFFRPPTNERTTLRLTIRSYISARATKRLSSRDVFTPPCWGQINTDKFFSPIAAIRVATEVKPELKCYNFLWRLLYLHFSSIKQTSSQMHLKRGRLQSTVFSRENVNSFHFYEIEKMRQDKWFSNEIWPT